MEYDLLRRLAGMCHLFFMSGTFREGFAELYAPGARAD